jgi:hypothetical protein
VEEAFSEREAMISGQKRRLDLKYEIFRKMIDEVPKEKEFQ